LSDLVGPPLRTTRFGPLDVAYDGEVLAPRPWTIAQAEWAIELSSRIGPGPVLELCAGVGHIGQVVAHATGRPLVQIDDSERACALAARNAAAAGLDPLIRAIDLDDIPAGVMFPIVLAAPPYVPSAEGDRYPDDPPRAIDGGDDGLDVARRCMAVAVRHLTPGGHLLIQLRDEDQAHAHAGLRLAGLRAVEGQGVVAHFEDS
jgi:methylase of polypeptide subunit release factors